MHLYELVVPRFDVAQLRRSIDAEHDKRITSVYRHSSLS